MSMYRLVNAPDQMPFTCVCRAGVPPFVETSIGASSGGVVYFCMNCIRPVMPLFGVVLQADFASLKVQLDAANEQLAELDSVRSELDTVNAALTNATAERDLARSENATLISDSQRLERDNDDLRDGKMPTSWVAEAASAEGAGWAAASKPKKPAPKQVAA